MNSREKTTRTCPAERHYTGAWDIGVDMTCGSPAKHLDANGVYRCGVHCDAARNRRVAQVEAMKEGKRKRAAEAMARLKATFKKDDK